MTIDYAKALKYAILCKDVYKSFTSQPIFTGIVGEIVLLNQASSDTQGAILPNGSDLTIVFRGTESSLDWEIDLDTRQERAEFDQKIVKEKIVEEEEQEQIYPYKDQSASGALMHRGFVNAYFSVRDTICQYIGNNEVKSVVVTGHSLGGALATLCAVDIQYNFHDKLTAIEAYTFGAPKVGNNGFRESYNRRVPNSYRIIHGMDIVAALPRWWQGDYHHVDQELRIGQRFSLNFISARFKDHAMDRYIEVLTKLAKG
ncbi:lipase family protein [Nostoc sp. TCL26-01]|uniref:lipase family protein n=1 Tax=Nostoc sp. TCL26-01 TaxID=2576904 RepID=UPI0015BF6775|nr:lipase family protein [Nostoc sp. TCL26-01]QLE57470.1 lipase family protein [Nostoc sp. TCL26-01]